MGHRKVSIERWSDFAFNTPSFLSSAVLSLFQANLRELSKHADDSSSCTNLVNSPFLLSLFAEEQASLALHPTERSSGWYSQKIQAAAPLIASINFNLENIDSVLVEQLTDMCSWLHQQPIVNMCFELLLASKTDKGNSFLDHYECLLLITAALERGLGNLHLYVSPKKKVPSLLRDLLASDELLLLLGQPNVAFLQLLLGNPLSLNLRNLSWHGFVQSGDFDARAYASVLLVMCCSIGSHLESIHSITASNIVLRRWAGLNRLPPKLTEVGNEELVDIINNTRGLPLKRKPVWLRAIEYHQQGKHGRCCVLILPEMEHLLRLIYCSVNNCPTRLLTAESVVHYTTLDTILDANSENRLPDFLGNSLFAALLDVFIEDEGPKLRDRFSHGECLLQNVSHVLSQHLLSLSASILRLADAASQAQPVPVYSAHFSLAAVFKRELLIAQQAFGELFQVLDGAAVEVLPLDLSAWPAEIESWLVDCSIETHHSFTVFLANKHFNRATIPASNTWRQLMRRVSNGCKSMADYKKSTSEASALRSRQRATLARFDDFLPCFVRGAQLALLLPTAALVGGDLIDEAANRQSIKVKKCAARWADNAASHSLNKRWNELYICTQQLEACFSAGLPIVFNV